MNTAQIFSIENNSNFDAPNFTGSPERRLLLAILERAILDFVGNDKREVINAGEWLFDDNSDDSSDEYPEFSFLWLCDQLDLDAQTISECIRQMPKRGTHRIAPWYLTKNYVNKEDNLMDVSEKAQNKG